MCPTKCSLSKLKKLLPVEFSPFQYNGYDNRGFLYPCNEKIASFFMKRIIILNETNPILLGILETEMEVQVKVRRGHKSYKEKLSLLWNNKCAICEVNIEELLRASHAKPWKEATPNERLDPYNGLLLCAHHDALFDQGLIAFDERGNIMLSERIVLAKPQIYSIKPEIKISLYEENLKYIVWHKQHIFKSFYVFVKLKMSHQRN